MSTTEQLMIKKNITFSMFDRVIIPTPGVTNGIFVCLGGQLGARIPSAGILQGSCQRRTQCRCQ